MTDQYEIWQSLAVLAIVSVAIVALYYFCSRLMRPFHTRAFLCLTAVLLGGWIVGRAVNDYVHGRGGFKLGVDLVGGTTLVYEVDVERMKESGREEELKNLQPARMVEFLKRRIDPNDLRNIAIRPVGGNLRYEIVLPTGGAHQARIKEEAWQKLLVEVKNNPQWKDALANQDLD